ncbi:hypothetical protein UFOVP119_93 [uncultured Caudovirales phage]|uniref:Uncharacterized protein n=1 Tax=uncultured Caudovirales phage TaxID=2100421 RepID=A0A6J5LFP9_9CAUD|nr:hypothetical protein UFOVP119_93 [uncultured Caudovirales phage]
MRYTKGWAVAFSWLRLLGAMAGIARDAGERATAENAEGPTYRAETWAGGRWQAMRPAGGEFEAMRLARDGVAADPCGRYRVVRVPPFGPVQPIWASWPINPPPTFR